VVGRILRWAHWTLFRFHEPWSGESSQRSTKHTTFGPRQKAKQRLLDCRRWLASNWLRLRLAAFAVERRNGRESWPERRRSEARGVENIMQTNSRAPLVHPTPLIQSNTAGWVSESGNGDPHLSPGFPSLSLLLSRFTLFSHFHGQCTCPSSLPPYLYQATGHDEACASPTRRRTRPGSYWSLIRLCCPSSRLYDPWPFRALLAGISGLAADGGRVTSRAQQVSLDTLRDRMTGGHRRRNRTHLFFSVFSRRSLYSSIRLHSGRTSPLATCSAIHHGFRISLLSAKSTHG